MSWKNTYFLYLQMLSYSISRFSYSWSVPEKYILSILANVILLSFWFLWIVALKNGCKIRRTKAAHSVNLQPNVKILGIYMRNQWRYWIQLIGNSKYHYEKYRNFTWFHGVEILPKVTVSTPGNQVKLWYFRNVCSQYFFVFNCRHLS